jgi:hypothetical protein
VKVNFFTSYLMHVYISLFYLIFLEKKFECAHLSSFRSFWIHRLAGSDISS